MNSLIEEENYDEAAKLCVKLFGKNKEMWENEAYKFASIRQLKVKLQCKKNYNARFFFSNLHVQLYQLSTICTHSLCQ